jgi:hypothetical protein
MCIAEVMLCIIALGCLAGVFCLANNEDAAPPWVIKALFISLVVMVFAAVLFVIAAIIAANERAQLGVY